MAGSGALKILLLAHDLSDPAIHRRAVMLREGGAAVTVAGFRRTPDEIAEVAGCPAVNLGRTYNAGFAQRILSVLREIALLDRHRSLFADTDIIIGRNLEMLAVGVRGLSMSKPSTALVYESLDIHRLLLRGDIMGRTLRWLEGKLAKHASALLTSSPAFISNYFQKLSNVKLPIKLVENKVLDFQAQNLRSARPRPSGRPWIIGWFGIIRCRKSLQILKDMIRQSDGKVEVVIRGRPAPDQFSDFEKEIAGIQGLKFLGPYKYPDDLAAIYGGVHFSWAIDMFEEGLNSSWLLPNRLYEGGLYNTVPIAIASVESGRFLQNLGIGVAIDGPLTQSLTAFFHNLTPENYQALVQAATNVPRSAWACDKNDCETLVNYLRSLKGGAHV